MNVLHLLVSGGTGGIEVLMKNYAQNSTHKNIFVFVWKSGEIAEKMIQQGIQVYVTNEAKDGAFVTVNKIHQICKKEKVDVVVSHNAAPLLKLALLYIKVRSPGIRTVAYAHANARDICEIKKKKGLWLRKAVHWLGFTCADGIIAISDSVKDSLQSYLKLNRKKIQRIYNGTNCIAVPRYSQAERQKELKLIYVGRLIPEKGVQNTLKMLSETKNTVSFSFMIVGDGPYRKALEEYSKTLMIADKVNFLGCREDVSELLASSDVFIHLPDWEEGFGITVIEALSEGCICIVNDRGALPEIIEHEKNGYIVPADAPETAVQVLHALLEKSEESWIQARHYSYQRAQCFTMDQFVEKLDGFLSEICA